jgi:hypothetical protein
MHWYWPFAPPIMPLRHQFAMIASGWPVSRCENGGVIARVWRGWAPHERAGDYRRHYQAEVSASLRAVSGFRGAHLLEREEGGEVAFTSITWFTGLDAVQDFAGEDYELAVVEEAARSALSRWDDRVTHHEVAVHVQ